MANKMNAPNIVYILTDDMGYGDVSWLNENSQFQTSRIDAIGEEGMTFTDAHASSAVSTPSRYSILTGRYNWRSERKEGVCRGYSPHLIEKGRTTVAYYLQSKGYATACVGKWHVGFDWPSTSEQGARGNTPEVEQYHRDNNVDVDYSLPIRNGPVDYGFDYFFGISASLDMAPYVYIENDKPTQIPDRVCEGETGKRMYRGGPIAPDFRHERVTPELTEKACSFIEDKTAANQPFFLYFPLPSPHTPIMPEEFEGKSGTNEYGDFCLMVDWSVGRLMDTLAENGVLDNTIVVFTADNGCSPKADFEELKNCGHHPSYVFRGYKADIYEGGHRIPLLIRWPEVIEQGTTCDEPVCLTDLFATCADILGDRLPDNAGEDSVSNLPVWRGDNLNEPLREAVVHHSINGSFSIRQGRWKLEFCPGSGGWSYPRPNTEEVEGLPPIQLYDLEGDIGERENLQAEYPEVVQKLTDLMTKYVKEGRSTPGEPQSNTGPRYWPQLNWMTERDMA